MTSKRLRRPLFDLKGHFFPSGLDLTQNLTRELLLFFSEASVFGAKIQISFACFVPFKGPKRRPKRVFISTVVFSLFH